MILCRPFDHHTSYMEAAVVFWLRKLQQKKKVQNMGVFFHAMIACVWKPEVTASKILNGHLFLKQRLSWSIECPLCNICTNSSNNCCHCEAKLCVSPLPWPAHKTTFKCHNANVSWPGSKSSMALWPRAGNSCIQASDLIKFTLVG